MRPTPAPALLSTLVLSIALLVPLAGSAQAPDGTDEPARVLVLGTYHFANPGLDIVKTDVADVLEPAKHAEIEAVVAALARFRPTRIAVERMHSSAARLDSLYDAYRAGRHTLTRDETEQLGFRLAERLGHERLEAIDMAGEFPFGAVLQYAQANDPASAAWIQAAMGEIAAVSNRRQREHTVGEILRLENDPRKLAADHGMYVGLARVAAGDTWVGADLLAKWYERNIRIFSNLQRIARSGERVLVIVGSGHAPILRELVTYDAQLELVEALEYLPLPEGAAGTDTVAAGVSPPSGGSSPLAEAVRPDAERLTPDGWGPLRIGMSLAEVVAAAGPDANPAAVGGTDPEQCDEFRPTRAPAGVLVMIERGVLTRISVSRNTAIYGPAGFRVGDPASRILAHHGPRARVEPHRYQAAPAQYITVWSEPADAGARRGIRYEIDAQGDVAHLRAGGPSIAYVEGCL